MFEVTVTAATAGELRHKLISLVSALLGEGASAADVYANQALAGSPTPPFSNSVLSGSLQRTEAKPLRPHEGPEGQYYGNKDNAAPEVRDSGDYVGPSAPTSSPEPAPEPAIATPEPVEEPILDPVVAIAAEKLKADVIRNLQDLFKAGKVKTIRHVLTTYGNGAKSFPEIDAARFPAIREALARNEGA